MKQKFIDKLKNIYDRTKIYISNNKLFLIFVVTSVINAFLLRLLTVKNYMDMRPILADTAVVVILGSFGYLFKPKNCFKYYMALTILFTFICFVNSIYYTNFLSFISISLLATSLQVVDVADAVVQNVMELKDFSYLWQILALIMANKAIKKKDNIINYEKKEAKEKTVKTIIAGLIIAICFAITLKPVDIGRLSKQWNREYTAMRFGIYFYQLNDIFVSIKPQISPLFGYDKNAKIFREYYDSKDNKVTTNEYTDIFKGKNVIVIHAESIQQFTMNLSFNGKELTPNLNKLASEGLYFSNYYAQESVGTSSDSEFTFNTSLMPASSGTVFISYYDREFVSIPKLLKKEGYYTFSMHGNNGTFWNRNVMHRNLGYDDFYYYNKDFEIDETIGLGLSDKSFFRQVVPKIKEINANNKNFYGTLIMLTNHTPFTDIENYSDYEVDYKYEKVNEETGENEIVSAPFMEGTKLGSYFKSVHYADEAIGQLINDLDNEGLLENTVIVLYGDHDAKLKKSEYERFYNYNPYTDTILSKDDENYRAVDDFDYEINRKVPFIIWSKEGLEHKEITEIMGMYDALPTLGNMFGFSSPYALGHDIFSVSENVVVFPDSNWITDKMYYNNQKGKGKLLNSDEVSIDYIEKYNKIAEDDISISNSIIVYDLIKKTRESSLLTDSSEKKR